jgi:exodeoxyribonuclease-3
MPKLKIATWNINSIRTRIDAAIRFLGEEQPDVLCLQEIKCTNEEFPAKAFRKAGYKHIQVRGQKGHHGVATVSRLPLEPMPEPDLCARREGRAAVALVDGIELHNYYFPSGGGSSGEPDPATNDKFGHKLDFWARLTARSKTERERLAGAPVLFAGDFNIAPGEHDVHNHKRLVGYIGHTPVESEAYRAALAAGDFTDVARALVPEPEQIPTWWSYRVKSWTPKSPGWRLDHFWASPALRGAALGGGRAALRVCTHLREWERPSDHAPVVLTLSL